MEIRAHYEMGDISFGSAAVLCAVFLALFTLFDTDVSTASKIGLTNFGAALAAVILGFGFAISAKIDGDQPLRNFRKN